jgi:hypothetical protein
MGQRVEPGQALQDGGQGVDRRVAARQMDALVGQDQVARRAVKRCSKSAGATIRGRSAPSSIGRAEALVLAAQQRRIGGSRRRQAAQRADELGLTPGE